MNAPEIAGLLFRLPSTDGDALALARRGLSAAAGAWELEPLFMTSGSSERDGLTLASAPVTWYLARPGANIAGQHPWDLAHAALSETLGLQAALPIMIEPDLLQDWPHDRPVGGPGAGFSAAAKCEFQDQAGDGLPHVPGRFAWHLDDRFSQLRTARDLAAQATTAGLVRIGQLDTGYDLQHGTRPVRLREDLQRNFLRDQPPEDVTDRGVGGLLKNPGHGTATLALLCGDRHRCGQPGYTPFDEPLGGAPEAEAVPLRVGNSVVQLYTSSVAAAIAYATSKAADPRTRIDVLSMSMGGLASTAWADAVNAAYEAGIFFVAAAGNNFSAGLIGVPTRLIVYPARFRRVVAACGVMADFSPYYGLRFGRMQGNWGPRSKMATALAAFTPNTPWAELGCPQVVDMNGAGTSSATPQIAAAAAHYLRVHQAELFDLAKYPQPWMRIEAIRHALFTAADRSGDAGASDKLGNGILRAATALAVKPLEAALLKPMPRDQAILPLFRVITGLGAAPTDPAERMLGLEATQLLQRWSRNDAPNPLEALLPDPDLPAEAVTAAQREQFLVALREHPDASKRLRDHAASSLDRLTGSRPKARRRIAAQPVPAPSVQVRPASIAASPPPFRRLRGFAIDPSLSVRLETAPISTIVFRVPWETLEPGPVGEYLEVIDTDPASDCFYRPVDLDDPQLLAQDGLPPSEGTPHFHQQMVYAVASLTIRNFEQALGRRTLWRPGPSPDPRNPHNDSVFVRRLRVHPHALRERNAYYSPQKLALLFGYFRATEDPEFHTGGLVFTCRRWRAAAGRRCGTRR